MVEIIAEVGERRQRLHRHAGDAPVGDREANDSQTVLANWEAIKREEKAERGEVPTSILDGANEELPALSQALKISKKAAKAGFEWPNVEGVWDKLREETTELQQAVAEGEGKERVSEELGDMLFTVVNLARWHKVHPELALRDVNRKFIDRFQKMEAEAARAGLELENLSLQQWDDLWNAAKTTN